MNKYFVVIEQDWETEIAWQYLSDWDALKEDFLISDFGGDLNCDYIQDAIRETEWYNLYPVPFLFDNYQDAKNAIIVIKAHNHDLKINHGIVAKSNYHIVQAETITITHPVNVLNSNLV